MTASTVIKRKKTVVDDDDDDYDDNDDGVDGDDKKTKTKIPAFQIQFGPVSSASAGT